MASKRITYIDTLKGICIILVVFMHCELPDGDSELATHIGNALRTYRMPTYYFLSGIFFKLYGGLSDFTRHKVNNIIIPLLFFNLLSFVGCALFAFVESWKNSVPFQFEWTYVFDILYRNDIHLKPVMPLWFLLSLFWSNIIFYVLKKWLNDIWVAISVLCLAIVGYLLDSHHIELPWFMVSSLTGLPYFVLGHYVKQFGWLEGHNISRWMGTVQFFVFAFVAFLLARDYTDPDSIGNVGQFLFYRYVIPFTSVLSLFLLCKSWPRRVPVVTMLGRYSIIVLGTHMFLITYLNVIPIKIFGTANITLIRYALFLMVIVLELAIVPLLRNVFPRFTAQQEFFKQGWKLAWTHKN